MIKLLIGGSPCTHWSIAQKNNRETEPEGLGWELFKNYLIAKEKFKPDFFLYENNKSAAQPIKDQISRELGVDLMYINSALVSAQNRQRFYAFNWEVEQPEDRGILLRDILESVVVDREKAYPLLTTHQGNARDYFKKQHAQIVCEPIRIPEYGNNDKARPLNALYPNNCGGFEHRMFSENPNKQQVDMIAEPVGVGYRGRMEDGKWVKRYESNGEPKANALTTAQTDSMAAEPIRVGALPRPNGELSTSQAFRVYGVDGKSVTINAGGGGAGGKTGLYDVPSNGKQTPVYEVKDGLITIKGKQYPIKLADGFYIIRKLTPVECERLQTLPDNYTAAVSNAQRYKGLGNGWTAEVIIHILNGALKDVPRDEEIVVLSMYDGIGTGRYCLDKMGFTNVRYYAYEIDKFAKQVAMSNYPDIIQCGDAFRVREDGWHL